MSKRDSRWPDVLLAVGIVVGWLWFIPYYPKLNPPNEGVRVYMTVAVVEEGTFAIDAVVRRWGYVNDKARVCELAGEKMTACPAASRADCRCSLYSSKAPLTSYLGVPVHLVSYWLHRALGAERPSRFAAFYALRLCGAIVPGLLVVWLLWLALGRMAVSRFVRRVTTAGFALGTMHFTYSSQFVGHAQAGSALLAACLAIEAARAGRSGGSDTLRGWLLAFAAGACTAAAPALEYPTGVAAIACGVFALVRLRPWPRLAGYGLGAIGPIALVGLFHHRAFGSPFTSGYSFLENRLFDRMMAPGFHGVRVPSVSEAAETLAVSLFSLPTGLFFFSPFLLLGVAGIALAIRAREPVLGRGLAITAAAVFVLMLAYLASLAIWRGGWQVGPRYVAAVVPFLALYAAVGAERLHRAWPVYGAALYAGLVAIAVTLTALPTWIYPHLPEVYTNPVFDLVVPLAAKGHVPLTAASVLRLYGIAAAAPAFVAIAVWLAWLCASAAYAAAPKRLTHATVALGLGLLVPLGLCQLDFESGRTRETTSRVIEKLYPSPDAGLAEAIRAATRAGADPATLGDLYARKGDAARAILHYRRATELAPGANKVGTAGPGSAPK